jgi:TolA-binding protein
LGDALYKSGEREEAFQHWDRVLEGAKHEGPFALAAGRYASNNLHQKALEVYSLGRRTLNNPRLFTREMAELFERLARYPEAVSEYLAFLDQRPQYLALVESRIRSFAREGDKKQQVFDLLEVETRKKPGDNTRMGLFTEYAIGSGRVEPALQVLLDLPVESAKQRTRLYRVASFALNAGEFSVAVAAYEAILASKQKPNLIPQATLGLARAQEGLGETDKSRDLYRALTQQFSGRAESGEARFRLAALYTGPYQAKDAAIETLNSLIRSKRRSIWRDKALFHLAEIRIESGQFQLAKSAYGIVIDEQPKHENADQARFGLAECHFYTHQFDSASAILDTLLTGTAAGFSLNDAMSLSLLLEKGLSEGEEVSRDLAQAFKLMRQKHLEPALLAFEAFSQNHPGSALSDRVLAARIELLEDLERYTEAIQACRRLPAETPESPLCPWSLMTLGGIQQEHLGQYYDALGTFEALLIRYPGSLEADFARDRVRALEKQIEQLEKAG